MNQYQPNFNGIIDYQLVDDPLAELEISTEAIIHQKPQFAEQLSGCEFPNRYYVFARSPTTGHKILFKCKEQSGCCQRNCCYASMRQFVMDLKWVKEINIFDDDDFYSPYVRAFKPFKCTCCCLERPEMIANFHDGGKILGIVKQPLSCCDPIFTINDEEALKYYICADCCQCGYCCGNNFCGKLSEIVFNIYEDQNMEAPVGAITKVPAKFEEIITNADSYVVAFPSNATPYVKLLLIITALMIDYRFFESSPLDRNDTNNNIKSV